MGIIKAKRAIILFLIIGVMAVVSGCARWPNGPEPEPGTDYQLEIMVEVAGEINSYDGIYYIVLDADGNPTTGPEGDILSWEDEDSYYYIKLEDDSFSFAKPGEDFEYYTGEILDGDDDGNKESFQVTIALSDLEVPSDIDFSIDINVVTTDTESSTIYDHLDGYFTIYTILDSTEEGVVSEDGSEEGEPEFEIVKVTAVITILY